MTAESDSPAKAGRSPLPDVPPRVWDGRHVERDPATGNVLVEGTYQAGLKHGRWKRYWPAGQLMQDYAYAHGLRHGPERDWAENGTQVCEGENHRGKRIGTWHWWHDNGAKRCARVYDDKHRQQGPFVHDHADGTPKARGQWLDDKPHGDWTWWDERGYEKLERGFARGTWHGAERAWFAGGVLAIQRTWRDGEKHGEEELYDATGRLTFQGAWSDGCPVGVHVQVDEDGNETRTEHVHGIALARAEDAKLRHKILKKLSKAKDEYAQEEALGNNLEYQEDGRYLYFLWKAGHHDVPGDPDLHRLLAKAHGLFSGADLVAFLTAAAPGRHGPMLETWPRHLDELVLQVYARDPGPLEAAYPKLPARVRDGLDLVRIRFGRDIGPGLRKKGLAAMAKKHATGHGIAGACGWPDDDGRIVERALLDRDTGAPTAHFETLLAPLGGLPAWIEALRPYAFQEAAQRVGRVDFRHFRDVVRTASAEEAARLIDAITLDNLAPERLHHALTEVRDDDVDTTVQIALAVKNTGTHRWPVVCTALLRLAEAGREPPASLLDRFELTAGSPSHSSQWMTDPLRWFDEATQHDPAFRLHYIDRDVGAAVPSTRLQHLAMRSLSPAARRAVIKKRLGDQPINGYATQWFYLLDDDAIWQRAIEAAAGQFSRNHDMAVYGLGELGTKALPALVEQLEKAPPDQKEAWSKAVLVALARATVDDGGFDAAHDRHVRFDAIGEDHKHQYYTVFYERVLYGLPRARAAAVLLNGLRGDAFTRAFAMIGAAPLPDVLEVAFGRLLDEENKLKHEEQQRVRTGLCSLGDARPYVRWILQQGAGGGIHGVLRDAVGGQVFEQIQKDCAAAGQAPARALDHIEKLRRRAAAEGGGGTTLYFLRPREEPAEGYNVIGGPAPGVDATRWPRRDDEPMAHLLTLDVTTVPGIAALVPKGARTVSVFCAQPSMNEAWEPMNDYTQVVFSTEAELAAQPAPPEDLDEVSDVIEPGSFEVVAIEMPASPSRDLGLEVYRASARVAGAPIWLQDDEGGGQFLMQFDEGFIPMNLGDAGVMYVFDNTAFWQCH